MKKGGEREGRQDRKARHPPSRLFGRLADRVWSSMRPPTAIRPATPADRQALRIVAAEAVWYGAATRYTEAQRSAWIRALTSGEGSTMTARSTSSTWVAERNGRTVGFASLSQEGLITGLYVHPDLKRRGIGRALLAQVEQHARAEGMTHLSAKVSLVGDLLFQQAGFIVRRWKMVSVSGEDISLAHVEKDLS